MWERFKEGMTRTRQRFTEQMNMLLDRGPDVDDEFWDGLEEALIMSDVGAITSANIVYRMKNEAKRHALPAVYGEAEELADDWSCVFFIRMLAADEPGVLSMVSGKLAGHGVSIASMMQKGRDPQSGYAQLVFLTHRASERAVGAALSEMDGGSVSQISVIRVEGQS